MAGVVGSGGKAAGPRLRNEDEAVAAILLSDPELSRKHYALMRRIIYLTWAHAAVLLVLFYVVAHPAPARTELLAPDGTTYAARTGQIPVTSVGSLSAWVTDSVVRAYTFNFGDWKSSQSKSRPNFTSAGWEGFQSALSTSELVNTVVSKKLRVTAVPEKPTVLLNAASGKLPDGREGFRFQMEILVTYEGPLKQPSEILTVQVDVVPQETYLNPRGWGIVSLVAI